MHRVEPEQRAALVEAELLRAGIAAPVDLSDGSDARAWAAFDLASMIDGCHDQALDPWTLDDDACATWLERLGESYEPPGLAQDLHLSRYLWLLDDGSRAGTIAIPRTGLGRFQMPVWSLYVHPAHRGRGIATRALDAVYEGSLRAGFEGLCLETHWSWQRSLRFYLARGMWVTGWERTIALSRHRDRPPHEVREEGDVLTLAVRDGPLLTAERRADGVVITEHGAHDERAHATLAVILATRGWPLVCADRATARRTRALGSLARAIDDFDALARQWGWDVHERRRPRSS